MNINNNKGHSYRTVHMAEEEYILVSWGQFAKSVKLVQNLH